MKRRKKLCLTYICFDKVGRERVSHLDNKEVEVTKLKKRHTQDNIVVTNKVESYGVINSSTRFYKFMKK